MVHVTDTPTHPRTVPATAPLTATDRQRDAVHVARLLAAFGGHAGYTALHVVCTHLAALYDERDAWRNERAAYRAALAFYAAGTALDAEGGVSAGRVLAAGDGGNDE